MEKEKLHSKMAREIGFREFFSSKGLEIQKRTDKQTKQQQKYCLE